MIDHHLREALTETAHFFAGGGGIGQAIADALRGVVARAGRYDAQEPEQPPVEASPPAHTLDQIKLLPYAPCLTAGCEKARQWKGLCRSCYGQALRLIDAGDTTWDDLETMGMACLDDKPFTSIFKAKKAA